MAIVQNRSTEIGDVIRVSTDVPVIGVITLNTFLDNTTNETATRYFDKFFRYSTDGGFNFSAWLDLTTINIQSIEITRKTQFVLEYRYTRSGTDATDYLAFNSISLSGDFSNLPYPVYEKTVFSKFFDINDPNVLGWALNVLEKLYKRGLIPEYIERDEDEDNPAAADVDYLAFFNTVTHYYAVIVYYARQYENIGESEILLPLFLESIGLFLNKNITQTHLQYIYENYTREFQRRGTELIANKGDESIPNGELLRLIDYSISDEFVFALLEPHATGWCISKSSPTFNYTRHCANMSKAYEEGYGFIDISKYPIRGASKVSIVNNEMVIENNPTTFEAVGIDYIDPGDQDLMIPVDDTQDYEITIRLSQSAKVDQIYAGVRVFGEDFTPNVPLTIFDESQTSFFFSQKSLYLNDKDYEIRGIIHSKKFDKSGIDLSNFLLNIGYGYDLKFNPAFNSRYIIPFLYTFNTGGGSSEIKIKDFKV